MKYFMFPSLVMFLSILSSASSLSAVTFQAPLNSLDSILGEKEAGSSNPLGYYPGGSSGFIGSSGSDGSRESRISVYGFLLPEDVHRVISATLTVTNINQDRGTTALDLWGLDTTDPDSSGTAFFLEAETDSNLGNVKLADDFFTTDTPHTTTTSIDLTSYIASLYAGTSPLPVQNEVFLRVNQDQNIELPALVRIGLNQSTLSLDIEFVAFSSITPVPEPSSFAIWSILGIGITYARSRRRRRERSLPSDVQTSLVYATRH